MKTLRRILKTYSRTYATASLFFQQPYRDRVTALYAWVRVADELVDNPTISPAITFPRFVNIFYEAWEGGQSLSAIHSLFVAMAKKQAFQKEWMAAFLQSMWSDYQAPLLRVQKDIDRYIYGSAEVIGLMMAAIMDLPSEKFVAAQALGRWMQEVNFLRDIGEDFYDRQRIYISKETLKRYGLDHKNWLEVRNHKQWRRLIKDEIKRVRGLEKQFLPALESLPAGARLPVYLAIAAYRWTLNEIARDPDRVLREQIKPSRWQFILFWWQVMGRKSGESAPSFLVNTASLTRGIVAKLGKSRFFATGGRYRKL